MTNNASKDAMEYLDNYNSIRSKNNLRNISFQAAIPQPSYPLVLPSIKTKAYTKQSQSLESVSKLVLSKNYVKETELMIRNPYKQISSSFIVGN